MDVTVLDLGLNNLTSLLFGMREARPDLKMEVVSKAEGLGQKQPKLIVIPGTGSFGAAMGTIQAMGLDRFISDAHLGGSKVLGICLGMQLLGSTSAESPGVSGLDLIPGESLKLDSKPGARVPNVGWAKVQPAGRSRTHLEIDTGRDFYFVHSYAFKPHDEKDVFLTSEHGGSTFVAAIQSEAVMGFQFHPEKSAGAGLQLLKKTLEWANE